MLWFVDVLQIVVSSVAVRFATGIHFDKIASCGSAFGSFVNVPLVVFVRETCVCQSCGMPLPHLWFSSGATYEMYITTFMSQSRVPLFADFSWQKMWGV
jgi:hypothetical protein